MNTIIMWCLLADTTERENIEEMIYKEAKDQNSMVIGMTVEMSSGKDREGATLTTISMKSPSRNGIQDMDHPTVDRNTDHNKNKTMDQTDTLGRSPNPTVEKFQDTNHMNA